MKDKEINNILNVLFFGQLFLDSIENISDKIFFKQKLKNLGKSFIKEMENTTNMIYKNIPKEDNKYVTNLYDVNYKLLNKLNNLDIFEKQKLIDNFEKLNEIIKQEHIN